MKLINKKQTGFTLIELIIVIVILGIMAVTAAPKFLDLQGDAHKATLEGVKGSLNSSINTIYGKSIIKGITKTAAGAGVGHDINKDGDFTDTTIDVLTAYGYPAVTNGIINTLDIAIGTDFNGAVIATQYVISAKGSTAPAAIVAGNGTSGETNDGCYVAYKDATSTVAPVITVNTDDC